ncbi:hypothetical protein ACJMQP_08860 [Rhodopseudomonas palustris]
MMRFPSVDRTATIAISMKVDRPGTIGLHPLGPKQRGGRPATAFLSFAMQSRRRRKKAGGGRCGIKIEATRFVAGLRSDLTNRVRGGRGLVSRGTGNRVMAAIDPRFL